MILNDELFFARKIFLDRRISIFFFRITKYFDPDVAIARNVDNIARW